MTDARVLHTLERTPRELFVPPLFQDRSWEDSALPIACGQTISQPLIVGLMTQALELEGRHRVLEVGTGSGYQTAVLARLARYVYTVERYRTLLGEAEARLKAVGAAERHHRFGDGGGGLGRPGALRPHPGHRRGARRASRAAGPAQAPRRAGGPGGARRRAGAAPLPRRRARRLLQGGHGRGALRALAGGRAREGVMARRRVRRTGWPRPSPDATIPPDAGAIRPQAFSGVSMTPAFSRRPAGPSRVALAVLAAGAAVAGCTAEPRYPITPGSDGPRQDGWVTPDKPRYPSIPAPPAPRGRGRRTPGLRRRRRRTCATRGGDAGPVAAPDRSPRGRSRPSAPPRPSPTPS